MSMEPIKTLIYGSCVSRDIVRVTEPRFSVTRYIARQSWVSAFTAPLADPGPTALTSPFQQRSLVGDFTSNAPQLLADAAPQSDLVLLDIDCELRGVFPLDGGYVSYTPELARSQVLQSRDPGPLLAFGTSQHLELFTDAAKQLRDTLARAGAMDRTVVVQFPFTDTSTTGDTVPLLAGRSGEEWNAAYVPYYEVIDELGFRVSSLPAELGIATPDHQWGSSKSITSTTHTDGGRTTSHLTRGGPHSGREDAAGARCQQSPARETEIQSRSEPPSTARSWPVTCSVSYRNHSKRWTTSPGSPG